MRKGPLAAIMAILLFAGAVWSYQWLKPYRYHKKLDAAQVLRIEELQRPGAATNQYGIVSETDQAAILSWFAAAQFIDDDDGVAGPGCGFVDMFIYLRSGDRVSISDRGDVLAVGQGKHKYFIDHPQLKAYLRKPKAPGGC